MSCGQDFGFYSRHKGKPLKHLKQRRDMIQISSSCCFENGQEEGQSRIEEDIVAEAQASIAVAGSQVEGSREGVKWRVWRKLWLVDPLDHAEG